MKTIIFLLLVTAAFTLTVKTTPQLTNSGSALKFSDFTGAGVTQDQITAFTNFANSASAFYKDDVEANAKYIKEQMDAQFGISGQNFFVVIQTEEVRFSWIVWVTNENVIASRSGINRVNPSWSYLFLKFLAPTTSPDYILILQGQEGSGITDDTRNTINSVVNTYEADGDCTCDDSATQSIGNDLIKSQGVSWSTICSATRNLYAYVYAVRELWIHAQPKNCFYTFYASQ